MKELCITFHVRNPADPLNNIETVLHNATEGQCEAMNKLCAAKTSCAQIIAHNYRRNIVTRRVTVIR